MTEAAARKPSIDWRVIAALLLLAVGVAYVLYEPGPIPFDRETWRNGERWSHRDGVAPRILMAEGMIRDRVLLGKTRAEVEEMLGRPSEAGYFKEYELVYWLGPERGFMSIDSEWLLVGLGATGRVREAKLAHD